MKVQLAFDTPDLEKALSIAKMVEPYVDSFEIDSLLLFQHGVSAIEIFRKEFPSKILIANTKIMDRSKQIVTLFSHAGADWVTIMAGGNRNVIHTACVTAHDQGKHIMLDLLDACSLGQSALEAKSMGVDALLMHIPYQEDNIRFIDTWDMVKGNTTLPIYIAGKITPDLLEMIKAIKPHGIVVGKAITESENPVQEAQFFNNFFNAR
jgi:3-hexulose-6-phosphate synthase